jgi:hypothetical protein
VLPCPSSGLRLWGAAKGLRFIRQMFTAVSVVCHRSLSMQATHSSTTHNTFSRRASHGCPFALALSFHSFLSHYPPRLPFNPRERHTPGLQPSYGCHQGLHASFGSHIARSLTCHRTCAKRCTLLSLTTRICVRLSPSYPLIGSRSCTMRTCQAALRSQGADQCG